jgi:hypothetical protein
MDSDVCTYHFRLSTITACSVEDPLCCLFMEAANPSEPMTNAWLSEYLLRTSNLLLLLVLNIT